MFIFSNNMFFQFKNEGSWHQLDSLLLLSIEFKACCVKINAMIIKDNFWKKMSLFIAKQILINQCRGLDSYTYKIYIFNVFDFSHDRNPLRTQQKFFYNQCITIRLIHCRLKRILDWFQTILSLNSFIYIKNCIYPIYSSSNSSLKDSCYANINQIKQPYVRKCIQKIHQNLRKQSIRQVFTLGIFQQQIFLKYSSQKHQLQQIYWKSQPTYFTSQIFMNSQSNNSTPEHDRMQFPPRIGNQYNQSSFSQVLPFNNSFQKTQNIKIQNPQYNYVIDESKRKAQGNNSAEYDLFQIEKKRKKQKYKRSTNNSHKKFISAIRRLFYAVISTKEKEDFEIKYRQYRSCRTFFFIILAYMKYRFSQKLLNSVRVSFINEMKIKINEYQEEIYRTKNMNLKNFREEEIIDIKYSIKSCNEYFNGNTRQAIESMYKKDKSTVIKRQHYESALKSVHVIQKQLMSDPRSPLEEPYVQDYSPSSDREKIQKKVIKRQIRETQNAKFALERDDEFDFGNHPFNRFSTSFNKKELRPTNDTDQFESEEHASDVEVPQKQFLYPPLLEPIPFMKYDPFSPPFSYKRQTKLKVDVREDFFGYMSFGFPRFYEKTFERFNMRQNNHFRQPNLSNR